MDNKNKNYSQPEQVGQNTTVESYRPESQRETVQNTYQVPSYLQPVIAYQGNQDDKRLIIRNAILGTLILIVFIVGVFFAFSLQHKPTKNLESKLSQNSQKAEISKPASSTSSAPSNTTSAPASRASETTSNSSQSSTQLQSQTYNLTNSNNGQTLNISKGSILNLSLAAQPGYQNTYHWDGLASSDTSTNCDDPITNSSGESLCLALFGSDKYVIGSDGSISDTNMVFAHTGDETLSYVYKPNCDTTCSSGQSSPIATWQVTVHVQ